MNSQLVYVQYFLRTDNLGPPISGGVNRGPSENFGLKSAVPTPGFGHEWKRSIENEEYWQQQNSELAKFYF